MTERLVCSNCGGPVTRKGTESRVTCTHCQNVTEFAPVGSNNDDDDDVDSDRGGHIPQIVIIQAPGVQQQAAPRIVQGPTIVVRRSSGSSLIGSIIFFVIVSVAISAYVHIRAARLGAGISGAVKEAEKEAEKGSEHRKK